VQSITDDDDAPPPAWLAYAVAIMTALVLLATIVVLAWSPGR
jgi:hypothetical protein